MAYTTRTRVEALMRRLVNMTGGSFDASSRVTSEDVQDWIDTHTAQVDVALSAQGYTVPITEPASYLKWLDKLVSEGVAATLLKSFFQLEGKAESASDQYEQRWRDGLKAIMDGSMVPPSIGSTAGAIPDGEHAVDAQFTIGKEF